MAGNSDTDESVTGPVADPVLSDNQAAETTNDIVDVLQKSTATVSKIYSVLFSKIKAEFMQDLSENNNAAELRYVRDMMFVIMKRRKPSTQYGNLVERRATENIKDTLLKDIYSIFCYGEGSTNSLPKNLFKADRFLSSSGTQTGLCKRLSKCINLSVCLLPLLVTLLILGLSIVNKLALPKSFELGP